MREPFTVALPSDVAAANLDLLRQYPVQTFDVQFARWRWRGALAIQAKAVRVGQPKPGLYTFAVSANWHDRREVMFPEFKLVAHGTVRNVADGAEITVKRVTFHPNWRSWTPAMGGAGLVALAL
ncbi:MAG: hypothetical protein AAF125_19870, partial [Chloroflexota bacterium]